MKNVVIVIMAVTVGVLGYLFYASNKSDVTNAPQTGSVVSESSGGNKLDLSDRGLDQVSEDILDDSSIVVLDVSGNNLTGALPAEIGQLSKLKVINYANNDISGLPTELGNLKNLEALDMRGNSNISTFDISLIQPKIPSAKILTD